MIKREILQSIQKSKKSVLLLGPRQTGKSTLINSLSPDLVINLAAEKNYLAFLRNNQELESILDRKKPKTVFIDEVQRIPSILNTIQTIIDQKSKVKFYLTGSSARKLRRGSANLLPGRLHSYQLGGLTASELGQQFDVMTALKIGTLPGHYLETDQREAVRTLRSYSTTYLKEEIQAEALTKNLEGFTRFLSVACAYSGQHIDYTKISNLAQVSRTSIIRYFEILQDTLLLESLYPFQTDSVRRLIQHPKIYFFDCGVLNALLENFHVSPDRIGFLFENLVYSQIRSSGYAADKDLQFFSYRTEHNAEIDMIIKLDGEIFAIEVKATKGIKDVDTRGFKSFEEVYNKKVKKIVVHMGSNDKSINGIELLTLPSLLKELGL
jgi:predicted AAA+ superfamily ATPase